MKNIMKTTILKRVLLAIFYITLFLLLFLLIYIIRERNRDPLEAINNVDFYVDLLKEKSVFDSLIAGKRIYTEVELLSAKTDTIKAIISFPMNYQDTLFPVVTILGGHRIGRKNFSFIQNPGQNIIIIYVYSYQVKQWEEGFFLTELPRVRQAIVRTPGQVVELLHWIEQQSWTDTGRVSLLGYSFGALFLPAVNRLASVSNIKTGPCILAYGGADFNLLLDRNLKIKPQWFKHLTAWFGSGLINTVDPVQHASYMRGNLYLINGLLDKQIPQESWRLLYSLIPGIVKIDVLNEGHMHPRKPELTQKLVDMSRLWLKEQGVLN